MFLGQVRVRSGRSRQRRTAELHPAGLGRKRRATATPSPARHPPPPSSPASYSSDLLAADASQTPPAPPEHRGDALTAGNKPQFYDLMSMKDSVTRTKLMILCNLIRIRET